MLNGFVFIGEEQYSCTIDDYCICMEVRNEATVRWFASLKADKYKCEGSFSGVDTEGNTIIVLTKSLKSIKTNVNHGVKITEITLNILCVLKFPQDQLPSINGILVKLDPSTCNEYDFSNLDEIDNWSFCKDKKTIMYTTKSELTILDILPKLFGIINAFRFILQKDMLGYLKVELLSDGRNAGQLCYCKDIEKYCCKETDEKLFKILEFLEPKSRSSIIKIAEQQKIYMAHITDEIMPKVITAGWFITTMAAFEWECRRFDFSSEISEQSIQDKSTLLSAIDDLINNSTGKSKKHFTSYKRIIERIDLNLSCKIEFVFNKFEEYFVPLHSMQYRLYQEQSLRKEIAARLEKQRNDFAHGNLDKDINIYSIIDIGFLRRFLYIIQLDSCGVNSDVIKTLYETVFDEYPFRMKHEMDKLEEYLKKLTE